MITIWNDEVSIGLQFTEGEVMQLYDSDVVMKDYSILQTEVGIKRLSAIEKELMEYASEKYPYEFASLKE